MSRGCGDYLYFTSRRKKKLLIAITNKVHTYFQRLDYKQGIFSKNIKLYNYLLYFRQSIYFFAHSFHLITKATLRWLLKLVLRGGCVSEFLSIIMWQFYFIRRNTIDVWFFSVEIMIYRGVSDDFFLVLYLMKWGKSDDRFSRNLIWTTRKFIRGCSVRVHTGKKG